MRKRVNILPVLFIIAAMLACDLPTMTPSIIPSPTIPGSSGGSNLPLKPVRFANDGTIGTTVMAWSYIPLGAVAATTPSNASTVASSGSSGYLSLPLGTYTWCYHWELGDVNGDGYMDYNHAIDNRAVVLDLNDSDTLELAERVDLNVPPGIGELPGPCNQASNLPSTTQAGQPTAQGSAGSNLPLKPVRFANIGTIGATVMAWTYIPPGSDTPAVPSNASTVASSGSSGYLSLPLGTYTWCYHWEVGDTNEDGYLDYMHALITQPTVLDQNDSDSLELAERVDLNVPPGIGELPGLCAVTGQLIQTTQVGNGMTVNIYGGDNSKSPNRPDLIVYANAGAYPPPQGISIQYSPDATPYYYNLNLENSSHRMEVGVSIPVTSIGVQFFADATQGWAALVLDGNEVWRGDTTSYWTDGYNYACYVEITGVSQSNHTLKVVNLDIPGIGGRTVVAMFFFGFNLP